MGKIKWSPEQELAINEEGKNIIVSAGAGSGKTAVLSERVLRKLKNGVHINELLVLTFTNAAAAEMKDRIRKKILKEDSLKEEANLIDGAYITTFDSFSLSIVKKYHTYLNISNNVSITDEVIIDLEKRRILDEIFDYYYENTNDKFLKLIDNYCLKDDKELKEYILNVYKKIELKYDKSNYLDNYISSYYSNEKIDGFVNEYLDLIFNKINTIKELIDSLGEYFDGEYINKIIDVLSKLLEARSYDDVLNGLDFKQLPMVPKNSPEEGKNIKGYISDLVKDIKGLCIYDSIDSMIGEINSTYDDACIIISILKELDEKLEKYKYDNSAYSFNDIARMAIRVVSENNSIKEELTNSFNEILVDEYQDTSDTQEAFINLISKNNVYMVGDIKQSIYRFRNANPYIFKNKYDSYRDTDAGLKIDLLKNFRSRREVLDNINLLFDLFMDDTIGGADYKASHRMVFGNKSYDEDGKTDQKYDMDILTYEEPSGYISRDEEEAFIICRDILDKVNNNYQIFDKDSGVLRNVTYNDFVVLLDRGKNFDLYKKIFEYFKIPLTILKDESLSKDYDILVIRNLLDLLICIKNKSFDNTFKYSFTSICRSFLYRLDDSVIYDYFVDNKFSESDLYKKCLGLVDCIDKMSISEYLYYALDEFDYDEKIINTNNIKSLRIREEYIYNLAKSYEETGKTIYEFLDYLDNIFSNDYDLSFNINTNNSNSSKIMTIHKSKGLEFPVCYFAGFKDRFNINELKEKIIFDNDYGIVLPKVDKYYKDTIIKTLLKTKTKREEISERIRLLYVAVTRAKEKMIIVMPKIEEESYVEDIVPLFIRNKYISFLDIMKSIYSNIMNYEISVENCATKNYLLGTNPKLLEKNTEDNIVIKEFNIDNTNIVEKHYSKESLHFVSEEEQDALDFGTKVHEVLEQIDFKNPNLDDYHLSDRIVSKINSFLNTELIKNNINNKMYKEYEFIYLEDGSESHGIIDLLIDSNDCMIIVDYKLKNIEDSNYDKQLNGYRKYISEKTGKLVKCYLYSIIDEKFREVL